MYVVIQTCLHGARMPWLIQLPGYQATLEDPYISFEKALMHLHVRQDNPPSKGTLSTCLRHPTVGYLFAM